MVNDEIIHEIGALNSPISKLQEIQVDLDDVEEEFLEALEEYNQDDIQEFQINKKYYHDAEEQNKMYENIKRQQTERLNESNKGEANIVVEDQPKSGCSTTKNVPGIKST